MFSKATLKFLDGLAANNNKAWFDENKPRYESLVREPALDFIAAMGPTLKTLAPHFRADLRKGGGSLMRVFRDKRFSHDKTPYKTNIGIQFRHELGQGRSCARLLCAPIHGRMFPGRWLLASRL